MSDIHLALSASAVDALVSGTELTLDLPGTNLRIYLRCDESAVTTFKEHIDRALLRLLPTDKSVH